jgi:hypothetical protein
LKFHALVVRIMAQRCARKRHHRYGPLFVEVE